MKKIIIYLFLFSGVLHAQNTNKAALYVSAGCSTGLLAQLGYVSVPWTIQADQRLKNSKLVLGLGYSNTQFKNGLLYSGPVTRHNVRARVYYYFNEPDKTFSSFLGGAVGASSWKSDLGYAQAYASGNIVTAQLFFGTKVNFSDDFFWLTEIAIGGPYMFQTSFGIKF